MNLRSQNLVPVFFSALLCTLPSFLGAQNNVIESCDDFFQSLSLEESTSPYFIPKALISSVIYDSVGEPQLKTFSREAYDKELATLRQNFEMTQTPLVLIHRQYGDVASLYCSVWTELTDRETDESISSPSIQSIKWLRLNGVWKIQSLLIQNELPSFPIDSGMLPQELLQPYFNEALPPLLDDYAEYDPNQVYKPSQVDEPPVYPSQSAFEDLLKSFDVVTEQTPGYTPFLVTISEDGGAELSYAHDLSGYQVARAESFSRSMLVWYPAIKDAASVKCQLTFFIRE